MGLKMKDPVVVSPPPAPWDVDCQAAKDGRTKQEFAKDCDVNEILKRCLQLGLPPLSADGQAALAWPDGADATGIGSFTEAMNRVKAAEDAFMQLPANVRSEFDNDPAKLIAFVQDDRNRDRAIELGLVAKPPVEPVAPVPAPTAPVVPAK